MTINHKNYVSVLLTRLEHSFISPPSLTILGYHGVSNEKTIVDIEQKIFEQQLAFLEQSFEFITLDQIIDYICGHKVFHKPAVALTFDDGYKDILTTIHPILQRKNIPATLFVMSDLANVNRKELANNKQLLTMKDIKLLHKDGWVIGSHSSTHAYFADKNLDITKEIINAKTELEEQLGDTIEYFAYPKGLYSKKIVDQVEEAGFTAALAFEAGIISQKTDIFTIPRMPVDATHTMEQFKAFFSNWGTMYLGYKQKWARIQHFHA